MTIKLFYKDPYETEYEATVTSINDNNITLDKTIFFAFAGGQESDSGTINNIPVKEAKIVNKDIIYTLSEQPNFKLGDKVIIKIDKDKRYKLMKLHSAVHLIFFLVEEKLKLNELIGSNISQEKGRLDYLYPKPISEILPEIEEKANSLLSQNLEIKTFSDSKDPEIRIWQLNSWHVNCGGTHVKNTKEIGKIKLKRKNLGAGKERIEITLT